MEISQQQLKIDTKMSKCQKKISFTELVYISHFGWWTHTPNDDCDTASNRSLLTHTFCQPAHLRRVAELTPGWVFLSLAYVQIYLFASFERSLGQWSYMGYFQLQYPKGDSGRYENGSDLWEQNLKGICFHGLKPNLPNWIPLTLPNNLDHQHLVGALQLSRSC